MKKLKTSTKIALNFLIYIFLISVFAITVNIYYFYTWTKHSYDEVEETINSEYNEIYIKNKELKTSDKQFEKFKQDIFDIGGYIISNDGKTYLSPGYSSIPNTNYLNIFQKEGHYYLIGGKFVDKVGGVYLFYDTYTLYESQINLIKISIIMLIVFSFFGFFLSRYITNSSLKNLKIITLFAKSLDFNNLNSTIEIDGADDDEIKIVANALNKAISKINYRAQKLKDFSSDVAHEFKTSLMIVNSEIDYANASRKYKDSLGNIKIQVKFLDYLISSLLSLKRLEGKILETKNENISDLVKQSYKEVEIIFKNKGLKISFDIKENIIKKIDKNLFMIVVNNLIFNAFKYTEKGEVKIKLDEYSLSIEDSGIGIAKENLSKIWARFYKESSQNDDYGSHGLGLSLVKEILDKHKFKIRVESKQNIGSKFIINFK